MLIAAKNEMMIQLPSRVLEKLRLPVIKTNTLHLYFNVFTTPSDTTTGKLPTDRPTSIIAYNSTMMLAYFDASFGRSTPSPSLATVGVIGAPWNKDTWVVFFLQGTQTRPTKVDHETKQALECANQAARIEEKLWKPKDGLSSRRLAWIVVILKSIFLIFFRFCRCIICPDK